VAYRWLARLRLLPHFGPSRCVSRPPDRRVGGEVESNMSVARRLLLVSLIVLSLAAYDPALAAPVPPELVVNHETQQCAEFWGGDECLSCSLPAGWEVLGGLGEAECPEGYATVEIRSTCTAAKTPFCCTEGHSGASGDCEDVVIDRAADRCAFVEDINECPSLPGSWEKHGTDCPYYEWADDVQCLAEENPGGDDGLGLLGNYQIVVAAVLCLLACSVSSVVLLVVLGVWLLRRRRGPLGSASDL
jgi:hypothetical protein